MLAFRHGLNLDKACQSGGGSACSNAWRVAMISRVPGLISGSLWQQLCHNSTTSAGASWGTL